MPLTGSWRGSLVDAVLGDNHAASFPNTLYFGLSTTSVNSDGTGATEPTDSAYARVPVDNLDAEWVSGGTGFKWNVNPILFPSADASWGAIVALVVFDVATGGSAVADAPLGTPLSVAAGQAPIFPANTVVFFQST